MSNSIGTVLKGLLDRYGKGLLDQSGRLKSLLQDEAPEAKREISLLLMALDERVPQDLMQVQSGEPPQSLHPRLAKRLADEKSLDRNASNWAVSTWAQGLGVAGTENLHTGSGFVADVASGTSAPSVGLMGRVNLSGDLSGQGAATAEQARHKDPANGDVVPPPPPSRVKWMIAAGVAIAAAVAWSLLPGKLEVTGVHPAEGLVGDGKKRDVVVEFKRGNSAVQSIQVRNVRGAGPWNPPSWTSAVTPEANAAGKSSVGPMSLRSTKPLTTTFEYVLVAQDGTRSAPFETTFDIAAAPVQPPKIAKVDVRGNAYTGRPVPVTVDYEIGTSDVAKVEVRQVEGTGMPTPVTQNVNVASGKTSGTIQYSLPASNAPQRSTFEFVLVDNQGSRSDAKRVSFDVAQAPVALGRQGVVTGIHEVTQQGDATGAGALVGGVLGGVLGHQVGSGRGNTAATVAGAVGGAVAGNLVEKNAGSKKTYQVAVRFNDGQIQSFSSNGYPSLRPGDRVKVVNGALQADR